MTPAERELKALAEKANAAVRCAPIFQWIGKGDAARSGYLSSPREGATALGSAFWLELSDAGSGRDMTSEEAIALREHIAACSPERILALLSRIERLEWALRQVKECDKCGACNRTVTRALTAEPGERAT